MTMLSKRKAKEILEDLRIAGEKASAFLLKRQKSIGKLKIRYKNLCKASGVVSDADDGAEEIILGHLQRKYPHIPALSEEMAHRQNVVDYREFQKMPLCFAIDPLDGSNNFVHGLDYYCISLALMRFGKPHIGLILRPTTGECFSAVAGEGSWLQTSLHARKNRLLVKRKNKPLSRCLFGSGLRSPRHWPKMRAEASVRQMGCAALDLCSVAAERLDGYVAEGLSPWDVAASAIILKEAGIATGDLVGGEFDCFGRSFLAAPVGIYGPLEEVFQQN